ncbi:unnamed protein product [Hydatigera taeniaeformis]|uniref:Rab-GAP TBC domain-containing protein n=1 Tax=Hydatigena taeniaeformis TaxID=6205 RepID=A0A0R3WIN4_HYDTA|nr:unnamed protein product [Hydatigera taeniaeformis]
MKLPSVEARKYLEKGCPLEFRPKIWLQCLSINVSDEDKLHYLELKRKVSQCSLLMDNLIHKEIKTVVSNDDMYFVFVDYIYKILLPFLRDPVVFRCKSKSFEELIFAGHDQMLCPIHIPPSGVVPFHGFSMYVSPLCYLYDDPVELYIVFRELYVRYFHKLHTINDNVESILSLCVTFERILLKKEPQLVLHLASIGAPPLQIAFRWLLSGFSGYLPADQVLLLWDRILAWDSLEIIPSEGHFANLM